MEVRKNDIRCMAELIPALCTFLLYKKVQWGVDSRQER
jgi:hypothetical protein